MEASEFTAALSELVKNDLSGMKDAIAVFLLSTGALTTSEIDERMLMNNLAATRSRLHALAERKLVRRLKKPGFKTKYELTKQGHKIVLKTLNS
jgi:hypothetical protein